MDIKWTYGFDKIQLIAFTIVVFLFVSSVKGMTNDSSNTYINKVKAHSLVGDTLQIKQLITEISPFNQTTLYTYLKLELVSHQAPAFLVKNKRVIEQILARDIILHGNFYHLLGTYYINEFQFDSALYYLNQADSLLKQEHEPLTKVLIYRHIAACYSNVGHYFKAQSFYQKAKAQNITNELVKNYLIASIATTFKDYSYYDSSLTYFLRLENDYKENKNDLELANVRIQLAEVYINLGDVFKAKKYLNQVLNVENHITSEKVKVRALIAMSNIADLNEAIDYLDAAIVLAKSGRYQRLLLYGVLNMAAKLIDAGESSQCMNYLRICESLNEKVNDYAARSAIYSNYGSVYLGQKKFDVARDYFERSLNLSFDYNMSDGILFNQRKIAESYEKESLFKDAYQNYMLYKHYYDSIFNGDNELKIKQLEEAINSERVEKQTEVIKGIIIKEQAIRNRNWFIVILILLVLVIISSFFFFKYRLFKKDNDLKTLKIQNLKGINEKVSNQLNHQKELLHQSKSKIDEWKKLATQEHSMNDLNDSTLEMLKNVNKTQKDWDLFFDKFELLNSNNFSDLKSKHPNLSGYDMRQIALVKLNFSISESSSILSVTEDSIKKARYRLKKKLGLKKGQSLKEYVNSI